MITTLKTTKLEFATRTYSIDPVPTTRGLRVSAIDRPTIQRTTRSAENIQYETSVSRVSAAMATFAAPTPSHSTCVP